MFGVAGSINVASTYAKDHPLKSAGPFQPDAWFRNITENLIDGHLLI
jgi:hypothetical protein